MICIASLFFTACQSDHEDYLPSPDLSAELRDGFENDSTYLYSREYALNYLEQNEPIDWKIERDARLLYNVSMYTDSTLLVIYKPEKITDLESEILNPGFLNDSWFSSVRNNLITELENIDPNLIDLTSENDNSLPIFIRKDGSWRSII